MIITTTKKHKHSLALIKGVLDDQGLELCGKATIIIRVG